MAVDPDPIRAICQTVLASAESDMRTSGQYPPEICVMERKPLFAISFQKKALLNKPWDRMLFRREGRGCTLLYWCAETALGVRIDGVMFTRDERGYLELGKILP